MQLGSCLAATGLALAGVVSVPFTARLTAQPSTPLLASDAACAVAAIQAKAPPDTTISDARVIEPIESQPRHCLVEGRVSVPGNEVAFRVALPEGWNGKFLFVGVGGLGGQFGSLQSGLVRRYATATTDTGHRADDPHWGTNRAKEVDYGHRGTHVTTVASKALTTAFYDRPLQRSYFTGCSNGGRQALMEVQRYPSDFDGVIAGHPATGTPMQVGRAIVFQKMLASPDAYLPAAKVELLANATLAACDAADGLTDGLVSDPQRCTFKPETLRCAGAERPDCLSPVSSTW